MSPHKNVENNAGDLAPAHLVKLYNSGVNISQYLRSRHGVERNSSEIIELAYELQAGSYVQRLEDPAVYEFQQGYTDRIAGEIAALCAPVSVLEAGVGEATTLGFVARKLGVGPVYHGFDLSWSRVATGRKWLRSLPVGNVSLCTGDLAAMPYADDSIDVVYTSHSIEPNGGREAQILQELHRVAARYLVLFEPDYENASPEAQARMREHGYCVDLVGTAQRLGMEVVRHEFLPASINPLNPTGLTIIRKSDRPARAAPAEAVYACPVARTPLRRVEGAYFSPDSLLAYPVIDGVPCLREKQAIVCCKLKDIAGPA